MKTERGGFPFSRLKLKATLRIQLLHSSLALFKLNDLNFCKLIQRLKFNFYLLFSVMLLFSLVKIPYLTSIRKISLNFCSIGSKGHVQGL